ncbi:MAG: hypothetical protein WBN72_08410 [Nitrososphaeraceae archaeon]
MSDKNSKKNKRRPNKDKIQSNIFKSEAIHLDIQKLESEFYRADMILTGVDRSVPSYEGRVFINNPSANDDTSLDSDNGYVGSYFVFGHPSCLGDKGHCDVHAERQKFNVIPNPLVPEDISIIITDKLKEMGRKTKDFTITIVPIVISPPVVGEEEVDVKNVVKLDKVSIVTYD